MKRPALAKTYDERMTSDYNLYKICNLPNNFKLILVTTKSKIMFYWKPISSVHFCNAETGKILLTCPHVQHSNRLRLYNPDIIDASLF